MLKLKYFAPAIGWGIFIFILSTLPGKDFPQIPDIWGLFSVDKLVHMAFYGVLTWLILRGWKGIKGNSITPSSFTKMGAIVALSCAGLGWFLEWYQENFCEDRLFELLDGIANSIGAVVAWIIYALFCRWKAHKNDSL